MAQHPNPAGSKASMGSSSRLASCPSAASPKHGKCVRAHLIRLHTHDTQACPNRRMLSPLEASCAAATMRLRDETCECFSRSQREVPSAAIEHRRACLNGHTAGAAKFSRSRSQGAARVGRMIARVAHTPSPPQWTAMERAARASDQFHDQRHLPAGRSTATHPPTTPVGKPRPSGKICQVMSRRQDLCSRSHRRGAMQSCRPAKSCTLPSAAGLRCRATCGCWTTICEHVEEDLLALPSCKDAS